LETPLSSCLVSLFFRITISPVESTWESACMLICINMLLKQLIRLPLCTTCCSFVVKLFLFIQTLYRHYTDTACPMANNVYPTVSNGVFFHASRQTDIFSVETTFFDIRKARVECLLHTPTSTDTTWHRHMCYHSHVNISIFTGACLSGWYILQCWSIMS
jgi:hypothetical protein